MDLHCFFKCLVKKFIYVFTRGSRSLKILIPFLFCVRYCFCWLHLFRLVIRFISQKKHNWLLKVKSIVPHCIFPFVNVLERLLISNIKNYENYLCVLKERIANLFIIRTSTNVKKIHCNTFVVNSDFFDTIIDPYCCYIFANKLPLAISLYNARLPSLSITYGY